MDVKTQMQGIQVNVAETTVLQTDELKRQIKTAHEACARLLSGEPEGKCNGVVGNNECMSP